MPHLAPAPMLARLEDDLPAGAFSYEPKWDGFRCLAERAPEGVALHSRHGRPFARYFPEVAAAIEALPLGTVVDGELVVGAPGGGIDFPALLARLHPAGSRVARLARERPASLVAFDLPAAAGEDLSARPFTVRRERLEALLARPPPGLLLTPTTRDPALARRWLEAGGAAGIDGVVAKADDLPYLPGKRAMVKVKKVWTADCVVAGLRTYAWRGGDPRARMRARGEGAPSPLEMREPVVASLLLGAWDGRVLRHVGVASSFPERERCALFEELRSLAVPLAGHPWARGFNVERSPVGRLSGSAGRWDPATMALDWLPLAPERVCEVAYDRLDGVRFRHPARFLRWRPDRDAASCMLAQLRSGGAPP